MRIVVLDRARFDLAWWKRYYGAVFPQGRKMAHRRFDASVQAIAANPFLGRPVEGFDLRQLPIPNTPFQIIYRVRKQTLEIVRVWDMRQKPSHGFQED